MRVLNKRYWPENVEICSTKKYEAERWCYENLKSANWRDVGFRFYFKRGDDATLFALKWS
jgi:hypothetical protein